MPVTGRVANAHLSGDERQFELPALDSTQACHMMRYTCSPDATEVRRQKLEAYFAERVLHNKTFICEHWEDCKSSFLNPHPHGKFYEGQLHYLGPCFDLSKDRVRVRVVVIGQEYGGGPACVTMEERAAMITRPPTNPHMRGTLHALQVLLGDGLAEVSAPNQIEIQGVLHHLFDAFALVNYLLCSAVEGDYHGASTPKMRQNCQEHFVNALEALDPTVVVVQGKGFWSDVETALRELGELTQLQEGDEWRLWRADFKGSQDKAFVAMFTHPSSQGRSNWGGKTAYLLNAVRPTLGGIRDAIGL
jgi:hypothetical protein